MYVVLITKWKLKHCFESHPITVVTTFPVGEVIHYPKAAGRITKWALELMRYVISYASWMAIKDKSSPTSLWNGLRPKWI